MPEKQTPLTGSNSYDNPLVEKKVEKDTWIYWKWPDANTYSKSYIHGIVETKEGMLLEISDSLWPTNYPTRILAKDIVIV